MAFMETVGKVNKTCSYVIVEWEIPDFFSLPDDVSDTYFSNLFNFCGSKWRIEISPNGMKNASERWMSLTKIQSHSEMCVAFDFFLKMADGSREKILEGEYLFEEYSSEFCTSKAFPRSNLLQRTTFAPSGILTIICCLQRGDNPLVKSIDVSPNVEPTKINTIGKLQQELGELLISSTNSDVTLNVKGKHLKAHRNILAARSTVFSAMMEHNMTEKATGIVTIEDSDPETFPVFLQYLYTGSVDNLTSDNVLSLYVAADKYQVDELKQICVQHMEKNITIRSFCDILTLSLRHQEEKLTELATRFFMQNSLAVAVTARWQSFAIENPVTSNELFIKALRGK